MSSVVRASQLFLPTLKDAPADAVAASHQLLVRAGFIRQLGAGLYTSLPLGRRSLRKLEHILRSEMDAIGAQEFLLPSLHPAELWRASGRWDTVDDTMFRLHDRRGGEYCLAMTHEEVFTALAAAGVRSYRQLPQLWYQIGLKFRDEPRPKAGLLRVREFQMKDAYSFDLDAAGLDRSFERMRGAYARIFDRCELRAVPAEAFSGAMGGRESVEFVVATDVGEDTVVSCEMCRYVANVEIARSRLAPILDDLDQLPPDTRPATQRDTRPETRPAAQRDVPAGAQAPSADAPLTFATPGVLTIDALAGPPYGIHPTRQLKTLVYVADGAPVVAVVRGDHALNEAKLQVATGAGQLRPAQADEILALMGAHAGSLGAVGFHAAPILVDEPLADRTGMVTGANRDGFHLRGVDVARDILGGSGARLADLRTVAAGEGCPRCAGTLESFSALEVGHIFKFGTRYSVPLSAAVLDADGADTPLMMGSYGIGLGRLLAAVVEQHHDDSGIIWPMALAPFAATVLTLGVDPDLEPVAEAVAAELAALGFDVLYDDRHERAGVKLNDADLIGIPLRLSVSRRGLADSTVEWKLRAEHTSQRLPVADVAAHARELRARALPDPQPFGT
jgi:prolyl-tRNA synthetase